MRDLYDASRDPAHRKQRSGLTSELVAAASHVAFEQALDEQRRWGEWALDRKAWKEAGEAYDLGLMAN